MLIRDELSRRKSVTSGNGYLKSFPPPPLFLCRITKLILAQLIPRSHIAENLTEFQLVGYVVQQLWHDIFFFIRSTILSKSLSCSLDLILGFLELHLIFHLRYVFQLLRSWRTQSRNDNNGKTSFTQFFHLFAYSVQFALNIHLLSKMFVKKNQNWMTPFVDGNLHFSFGGKFREK